MEIVIVTGMSGAGKSQALNYFEDSGYYAIDNLPPSLLENMVEVAAGGGEKMALVAVVIDVRSGTDFADLLAMLERLESVPYTVIFLNATDDVLMRRFSETRRLHPLEGKGLGVARLIEEERRLLSPLREKADIVIDTSGLSVRDLRDRLADTLPEMEDSRTTLVTFTSFGYKYGHPLDADIIFDVRFLPNPYWIAELRDRKGTDKLVREYVFGQPDAMEFIERVKELIDFTLPGYQRERRPYLTIAIGCTGGRHRSVVIANELARRFKKEGQMVSVTHRDISK